MTDTFKLGETLCCLCDALACADPRPGFSGSTGFTPGFEATDLGTLHFCATHWGTRWRKEEAEEVRARRKSPPAADRTWTPERGALAVGYSFDCDNYGEGKEVRGELTQLYPSIGVAWLKPEKGLEGRVHFESLRPASPSLPEAQFKVGDYVTGQSCFGEAWYTGPIEFSGARMIVLNPAEPGGMCHGVKPETLRQATHPPATEPFTPKPGDWVQSKTAARNGTEGADYRGEFRGWRDTDGVGFPGEYAVIMGGHDEAICTKRSLRPWEGPTGSHITKREPSRPAEAKVDPYAEHRRRKERGELKPRHQVLHVEFDRHGMRDVAALTGEELDRALIGNRKRAALNAEDRELAAVAASRAKRSAHVETLRKDFDRPSPRGKHDWDPEDADSELRVS